MASRICALFTAIAVDVFVFASIVANGQCPSSVVAGPPVVEAVPDSIHLVDNQLLVTLLSGFPFPIGNAEVRAIDIASGTNTTFISGLTSAIDVARGDNGGLLTLEFSTNMLAPGTPGRLSFYASPSASPVVLANYLFKVIDVSL